VYLLRDVQEDKHTDRQTERNTVTLITILHSYWELSKDTILENYDSLADRVEVLRTTDTK